MDGRAYTLYEEVDVSGGAIEHYDIPHGLIGRWEDEELNEMFSDLFGYSWCDRGRFGLRNDESRRSEFGPRGGGLFESLDFYLSDDISREDYLEDLRRFKRKWFVRRTPKNRVEYYTQKFRENCRDLEEQYVLELGLDNV